MKKTHLKGGGFITSFANLGLIAYGIALLFFRLNLNSIYDGEYLWAEDGSVFLNQASEFGMASLTKGYAGYLHFYPRVISLIASYFTLTYRPVILFLGWLLAYGFMVSCLTRISRIYSLNILITLIVITFVTYQPSNPELFFNITNSQWILGLSLTTLLLVDDISYHHNNFHYFILIGLLSLTGPFSLILTGLLFLKILVKRDWKLYKIQYLLVFFCATVQCYVLYKSQRLSGGVLNFFEFLKGFVQLILWSQSNTSLVILSIIFWVIFITSIIKFYKKHDDTSMVFLMIASLIYIAASLYSSKSQPLTIVPYGSGNRYTWIPYGIFIICSSILTVRKNIFCVINFLIILVFILKSFFWISPYNLHFQSFAKLASHEKTIIPINPSWPAFPGWSIEALPGGGNLSISDIESLSLNKVLFLSLFRSDGDNFRSTSDDPQIIFNKPEICTNSTDIGVKISFYKDQDGWTQIFWGNFSEKNSIRRWYPKGNINAEFAFPNADETSQIRFDPLENIGQVKLDKIRVFCLK